ncbi:MAG: PAS domain-containing protein [Methanospirillaceae archaeon]|nr:PAS domain-containing protein [Methanospirillaceae archaeon]
MMQKGARIPDNNRLTHAFSEIPSAILIENPDLSIQYINKAAELLLGFRSGEIQGYSSKVVYDFLSFISIHRSQMQMKPGSTWSGSGTLVTREGGSLPCQISIQRMAGHTDYNPGYITVFHPISTGCDSCNDRDAGEKNPFAVLMDCAGLVFWERDVTSGHVFLYGGLPGIHDSSVSALQPIPLGFDELIHPDDRARVSEAIEKHRNKETDLVSAQWRIRCKDGSYRWILDNSRFVRVNKDNRDERLVGFYLDITDVRRVQDACRKTNKTLQLLSASMRHDCANYLTALGSYCELCHEFLPADALPADWVEKISDLLKKLMHLLSYSRNYETLGIAEPSFQRVTDILNSIPEKNLAGFEIITDESVRGLEIYADMMLSSVFTNFIDNAARHGETVSSMQIQWSCMGPDAILLIEDDGAGVPHEEKEKIFERSFGKNTGLGLFLAREILAVTGISLTETGEPGCGARFELYLPAGTWRVREHL